MTFPLLSHQGDETKDQERRNESNNGVTNQAQSQRFTVSNTTSLAYCSAPQKEASQAGGNNVSALVAKSKIAAASLHTLLHAKNCRLGVAKGQKGCPHKGCPEAKLMYLHLKTCTAGSGASCPTKYKGCEDARKLLAHYRRCRDTRARQATNPKAQQHVCLVCTLVARQVKGNSDRTRSTSPKGRSSKHLIPSLNLSSDSNVTSPNLVRPRSTSPPRIGHGKQIGHFSSSPQMPPPRPRFPFSKQPQSIQSAMRQALGATSYEETDPAEEKVDTADEAMLGKSLDTASGFFRARAHSLDQSSVGLRVVDRREDYSPGPSDFTEEKFESSEEIQEKPRVQGRQRSASCHILSSPSKRGCDTILEEPVVEELQSILEGDS